MASQTQRVESDGRATRGLFGNAAEFIHDLVTLSELQFKLLILDVQEGSRHALLPLGLIAFGLCLGLGCFPVLLAALGLGMVALGLAEWLAFLIAAVIGVLVSGAAAYGGYVLLKRRARIIERSKHEFSRNLEWVKTALTNKPRPTQY